MTSVLLVDDEPLVLKSLLLWFRRLRPGWRCATAPDAAQALVELSRGEYDAVVSDMRMPGMDGADLLARVRAEHPMAARIVLTGHAERDAMERASAIAHEVLAKPCSASDLVVSIERACALARGG